VLIGHLRRFGAEDGLAGIRWRQAAHDGVLPVTACGNGIGDEAGRRRARRDLPLARSLSWARKMVKS
jgi:hypothetical protein